MVRLALGLGGRARNNCGRPPATEVGRSCGCESATAFFLGLGEPVGLGTGLDDVRVEGDPVDDRRAEAGINEGLLPLRERSVRGDRDGPPFLSLGEDLEQQFGPGFIQVEVAELVQAEKVDAAVSGDGAGQFLFFSSAASASSLTRLTVVV